MARRVAAAAGVLALWVAVNAVHADPAANDVLRGVARDLGFAEAEVARVESGAVVTRPPRPEGTRGVSLALLALLPSPAARAGERVRPGEAFEADSSILDWGSIDEPVTAASFEKLMLPAAELEKLAGDEAASAFNLSRAEQELLASRKARVAAGADRKPAALAAYREILWGRVQDYQAKGLAGIAPYQHGDRQAQPRQELESLEPGANGLVARIDPDLEHWLRDYPRGGEVGASSFLWRVETIDGRAAVVLAHRVDGSGSGGRVSLERDFYVGHGLDARQAWLGVVPAGDAGRTQSVLFYSRVLFGDRVAGLAGATGPESGRKIATTGIRTLFESARRNP